MGPERDICSVVVVVVDLRNGYTKRLQTAVYGVVEETSKLLPQGHEDRDLCCCELVYNALHFLPPNAFQRVNHERTRNFSTPLLLITLPLSTYFRGERKGGERKVWIFR